jgi:hypothetical protein
VEEKDTVETVENETYYDGTTDEEYTAEEPETEEGEEDVSEVEEDRETFDDEEEEEEAEEDPDEDDEEEPDESEAEPTKNIPEKEKDNELEEEVRALLNALGLKDVKDPKAELEKLVAESKGQTAEKYREDKAAKKAADAKWKAQAAQDIDAIHKAYPGTKKYNHVWELPNALEFGKLMNEGKLSVTAAFAASHPDIAEAHSKRPVKNGNLNGTKTHITSSVPKGAKDNSTPMSKSEMESYREMFPDLSKAEIKKLYKKIK